MLTIESSKLTGTPNETGWSQVYDFSPEEIEKKNLRGRLFVVVSANSQSSGVEAVSAGREIISCLHDEYFGNLTTKPFNALKNAVEKTAERFRSKWERVEIVASSLVGGVVYSAAIDGGRVVVCREGAMGTILDNVGQGVVSSSGFPKVGDMLLMATKSFFEKIPPGLIRSAVSAGSCEQAVEFLAPSVRSLDDTDRLGVVVIKFKDESLGMQDSSVVVPKSVVGFSVIDKVSEIFKKVVQRFPQKSVYVKPVVDDDIVDQSKKTTFSVALVLILILFVSIGFGIRQKSINDSKVKYKNLLVAAENDVDQAISLASIDSEKSRVLFKDSEQKLNEILSLKINDSKISDLQEKINTSRAAILGEYLMPADLFSDLTLLSSGFKGDTVSTSGGNLYVLDKNGKKIVSVALDTKKSKVVAGPTLINEAFDLASYEDRAFVLMSDGVYEVGQRKTKVIDKVWGGDALIKAFAGNVYVLDKTGNSIYRYAGSGDSFGDKQDWLASGTKTDFSDATQWVIDGSVYIRFPDSQVSKFSQGSPQAFSVSGVVPEIGNIDFIFADADNTGVYILDRAGKRVVVVDKKGKYMAQYINDQITVATGVVVSETSKKIILLTGDKLYSIDIRHTQ